MAERYEAGSLEHFTTSILDKLMDHEDGLRKRLSDAQKAATTGLNKEAQEGFRETIDSVFAYQRTTEGAEKELGPLSWFHNFGERRGIALRTRTASVIFLDRLAAGRLPKNNPQK